MVNKLVEECIENIEETRLVEITSAKNENKHKCSFCTLLLPARRQQFNELINGKCQTNTDQKSNLLFLQRHNQSQNFESNLLKIDKSITKALVFTILDTLQLKKLAIVKLFTV